MRINTTALLMVLILSARARSATETVLYSFRGGNDGGDPAGSLLLDSSGNLLGTADAGGSCSVYGGTLFKLDGGKLHVLHSFCGPKDGWGPWSGVVLDSDSIYGTTYINGSKHCGTVFKVSGSHLTTLHSFSCGADGGYPFGGVIIDKNGNLYGTTDLGGTNSSGVIYEIKAGVFRVLYNFCSLSSCADGANPGAALSLDSEGSLYGITSAGGDPSCFNQGAYGCGTVFKLSNSAHGWTETVLHRFSSRVSDGKDPVYGALVATVQTVGKKNVDVFYGVTAQGGNHGFGSVFQLTQNSHGYSFNLIHSFNELDGSNPYGTLLYRNGTLYGTTTAGGDFGFGTVFKLTQHNKVWAEKVLYSFSGGPDGSTPYSGVITGSAGDLYGVTFKGGDQNFGVVYKIAP